MPTPTAPPAPPAPSGWLGHRIVELESCGSTNDEALALARAGAAHGTVVVAHAQTAGRGREGRTWRSPPGSGLYVSAIVRPALPLAQVPPLTLAVGVGAVDAVRAAGVSAQLKWPNDLLVRDGGGGYAKLGGILVEAHSQGARLEHVIVGIGINLRAVGEPGATSIEEASGAAADRVAVLTTLCDRVGHWIDAYVAGGVPAVTPAWHARMAPGLAARAGALSGAMIGLAADGALLLRDAAGQVHAVRSGDVQVERAAGRDTDATV